MLGAFVKFPASAPMSTGVNELRVCPSKSTVTVGMSVPELSTTETGGNTICKSPVAEFTKFMVDPEIELASLAEAVCQPAKSVPFASDQQWPGLRN